MPTTVVVTIIENSIVYFSLSPGGADTRSRCVFLHAVVVSRMFKNDRIRVQCSSAISYVHTRLLFPVYVYIRFYSFIRDRRRTYLARVRYTYTRVCALAMKTGCFVAVNWCRRPAGRPEEFLHSSTNLTPLSGARAVRTALRAHAPVSARATSVRTRLRAIS